MSLVMAGNMEREGELEGEGKRREIERRRKKEHLSNSYSGHRIYCQNWDASERKRDTVITAQG